MLLFVKNGNSTKLIFYTLYFHGKYSIIATYEKSAVADCKPPGKESFHEKRQYLHSRYRLCGLLFPFSFVRTKGRQAFTFSVRA